MIGYPVVLDRTPKSTVTPQFGAENLTYGGIFFLVGVDKCFQPRSPATMFGQYGRR